MPLTDYNYRLKAMPGDTAPHDELGVSGNLTGGTMALVDRGNDDMAWRFSGGQASVAIPLRTVNGTPSGSGITIAVTLKVTNYGTVDFRHMIGIGPDVEAVGYNANSSTGVYLARTSANLIRAMTAAGYTSAPTIGTVERTHVVRITIDASGTFDSASYWIDTAGRVGSAANYVGTSSAKEIASPIAFDTFSIDTTSGIILEVKDFVVWPRELSDSEAALVADGLRNQLDIASDTTPPVMTGTLTNPATTSNSFTIDWSGTSYSDNVGVTGFETSLDGTAWTDRGMVTSFNFPELAASTAYTGRVRARDLAGNVSTPPLTLAVTTSAAVVDTTAPGFAGEIVPSLVKPDGFTLTWPNATDAESGVGGYMYSINGGAGYTDVGLTNSVTVSGRPASTAHDIKVKAYDVALNESAALSASVTTLAPAPPTFTTQPLANNTGTAAGLYANTVFKVFINEDMTGALVAPAKTVTTNSLGVLTFTEAACVRGVPYSVRYKAPNGEDGLRKEIPV